MRRSSADLLTFVVVDQGCSVGAAYVLDPATGAVRFLASHGDRVSRIALDASGTLAVTGSFLDEP